MSSQLSNISSDPLIYEFWAGASTRTARPVAKFLAPEVLVQTAVGHYKKRGKDSRLPLGNFARDIGGDAALAGLSYQDEPYDCQPYAMDHIVDKALGDDVAPLVKAAITSVANIAAEDTERRVIRTAIAAAGAGTGEVFTGNDPVAIIDTAILALIKSAKSQDIGMCFDPLGWGLFKNNPNVIARCKGDVSFQSCPNLFHGGAEFQTAYAFFDAEPSGPENIEFVMPANTVLIFARSFQNSQDDPSAMKTLRLDPSVFEAVTKRPPIAAVETTDGRKIRVVCDWSEQIVVANEAGFTRFNVS